MGQTLGLLGFGHIGQEVARRARALRHAGAGVEPPLRDDADARRDRRPRASASRSSPSAEDAGRAGRRDQRAPGADQGHARLRQRRACSARQAGRDASSTPRAPRSSITTALAAAVKDKGLRARPRRVRQRAVRRRPASSRIRWCRSPTSTARTTSARRPTRRRKRLPRRPSASFAPSRTPARCRTWSTWPS